MLVNLDVLIDPKYWPENQEKKQGVAVIDECIEKARMSKLITPKASPKSGELVEKSISQMHSPTTRKNKNKARTPRKKNIPSKLQNFVVVRTPSGICPKCCVYVKETDDGVVCKGCQAFLHYSCAGVTQKDLDESWSGRSFLCPQHRGANESYAENH